MIEPMLATDFNVRIPPPKERMFPCYIMPKLDGIRAIWYQGRWQTRRGKLWNPGILDHIQPVDHGFAYDGELYCHGLSLQQINEAIGVNNLKPGQRAGAIQYHIFDLVCPMWMASARREKLRSLNYGKGCVDVIHQTVGCYDTLNAIHHEHLAAGYEGSVLKPLRGQYFSGKTGWLLKYKPWDEDWFEITGAAEGIGKFKGMLGAFSLRCPRTGVLFSAGGGTDEDRAAWWASRPRYAYVKYYGRSDANIPLKPSVLRCGNEMEDKHA